MEKIKIKVVDEIIYHEVLDNGLNVYIYKKEGMQKKSVYFQTKYGSLNNEFIPTGSKNMKSFPLGIAHFLEHKLFESDDNSNIFELFEKNGAYVNASTSHDYTVYFFSCTNHFYDNLELLINMVLSPYFTDENVEKEKGIIGQELDMYSNDPNQAIFERLFYNSIINSPLKYDIGGTKEEVNKITKEDLYECYNTFYDPSNMSLFIAADENVDKIISFVNEIMKKRSFNSISKIVKKEYLEPKEVAKKEEVLYHNVVATKIGYAYKIILPKVSIKEEFLRRVYIRIFLSTKFGSTSLFTEKLIKEKLVKSYFYYDYTFKDNIIMIFFTGDILDDNKVNKMIEDKLVNFDDLEDMFNLLKKNYIASYVKSFESADAVQNSLRAMVNTYGVILDDIYELYSNASFDDYLRLIKSLEFKNKSKIIIKNKEK